MEEGNVVIQNNKNTSPPFLFPVSRANRKTSISSFYLANKDFLVVKHSL